MGRWIVFYGMRERTNPDPVGDKTKVPWLAKTLKAFAGTKKAGWCQGLDSGAKVLWNEWYRDVMTRNLPSNIIGIRARAPTLARKVCLCYGWDFGPARQGKPWRIDVLTLELAIQLVELHIKSLTDLSYVIADHPDARLRRSVLMAIESKGGLASLGEILGVMKMRKRPILEMLDSLKEEGRVRKVQVSAEGGFLYESVNNINML